MPIYVPLSDIARIVAPRLKRLADTLCVRRQRHVVHEHARRRRKTPRQKAGPSGRTDGRCTDRIGKIDRFFGELVDMRGIRVGIAVISLRIVEIPLEAFGLEDDTIGSIRFMGQVEGEFRLDDLELVGHV